MHRMGWPQKIQRHSVRHPCNFIDQEFTKGPPVMVYSTNLWHSAGHRHRSLDRSQGLRHLRTSATVATLGIEWAPGLLGQWRLLKNLGTQRRGGWLKEDFSCFRERRPKGRSKEEFAQKKVKMFQVQPMRKLWREIAQTSGS